MSFIQVEDIEPNLSNFVKSFRDIGYSFEVAVADIIDNSLAAKSKNIDILFIPVDGKVELGILDDGEGMSEAELKEAMRLASKDPSEERALSDLGRFGMGLKSASFSQCKRLTVVSKENENVAARQWDLDYICEKNTWSLITPNSDFYSESDLYKKLAQRDSGTLVIWDCFDKISADTLPDIVTRLNSHLALVFHRFLEGESGVQKINITVNGMKIKPFDPFGEKHEATIQKSTEHLKLLGKEVHVTPYILPHHSKLSQKQWDDLSTTEGYIKSQGFYLYRGKRLLVYGTWWGLHKASDAHKLVRIKIDITNDQDENWGIDIKKSTAHPRKEIRKDLKRIIHEITREGVKPFTGRSRKVLDKSNIKFWSFAPKDKKMRFVVNHEHPLLVDIKASLTPDQSILLDAYLEGIQSYLPLEAIQSKLQQSPHEVEQNGILQVDIEKVKAMLLESNVSEDFADKVLNAEMFK